MSGRSPYKQFYLAGKRKSAQDRFFKEALQAADWTAGGAKSWDTCWYTGMPDAKAFKQLTPDKSINHIPGNNCVTVKSSLYTTLEATRRRVLEQKGASAARRLGFFPKVYSMPEHYHAFLAAAAAKPEQRWILKPKNASRGRGISMVKDLAQVPLDAKWMVQEYIDNPHLLNSHKYVLRLYVLITSVDPLRVYLFKEGSAKLASADYDPDDLDNLYAHLTNPDINVTNANNPSAVIFLSFQQYRDWLREQGLDDKRLFREIEEMLLLTVISAREKMRHQLSKVQADTTGCYELLGIDCLVDVDLKPWIMECNLSPSLDICAAPKDGGDIEEHNKRQLVEDMIKLLGLTQPRQDLSALEPDERIRVTAAQENQRAGGFKRLFPAENAHRYLPYFALPRLADKILADAITGTSAHPFTLQSRKTAEIIADGKLSLYCENSATLYTPNETASWIWLRATDGADPDVIADEMLATQRDAGQNPSAWQIRQQVWNLLADWAESGMLIQTSSEPAALEEANKEANASGIAPFSSPGRPATGGELLLKAGEKYFRIWTCDAGIRSRLCQAFGPLLGDASKPSGDSDALTILQAGSGYAVTDSRRILVNDLSLGRIVPAISSLLLGRSVEQAGQCLVDGILVPLADPSQMGTAVAAPAVFLIEAKDFAAAPLALRLAQLFGHGYANGISFPYDGDGSVSPVGWPMYILEKDADRFSETVKSDPSRENGFLDDKGHLHESESEPGEYAYAFSSKAALFSGRFEIQKFLVVSNKSASTRITVDQILAILLSPSANGARRTAGEVAYLSQWLQERPSAFVSAGDWKKIYDELQQPFVQT